MKNYRNHGIFGFKKIFKKKILIQKLVRSVLIDGPTCIIKFSKECDVEKTGKPQ